MSRPVALTRGLLVATVIWLLGSLVTINAFSALHARTTITDVSGPTDRVQIIWWAAHAFCACVGGLLGVAVGGRALTDERLAAPGPAAVQLGVPVLSVGVLVLAAAVSAGAISGDLALACGAGLLTGVAGGAFYVVQCGMPEEIRGFEPVPRRSGHGWGSR